jgi:hypothetical protein
MIPNLHRKTKGNQPPTLPGTETSCSQLTRPPPQPNPNPQRHSKLTNKKYISTINGSITGSWKIDTSLVVPRLMRGSTAYNETPETRPNLRFATINVAIKVDLTVLDEYDLDQRERVSIVWGSVNGKIECAIVRFSTILLFPSSRNIPPVIS